MPCCSKPAALLRSAALALLLAVPYRFLPDVLPAAVLPLWGLCCTAAVHFFYKKGIRAAAALLLGFLALGLIPAAALGVLALVPHLLADILFLRIKAVFELLMLTGVLAVCSAVLFLYTERWRRFEPLAAILLCALLFFSQQHYRLTAFSHPLWAVGFAGAFMLLQIALLAIPVVQRRRFSVFLAVFLCIATALLIFFTQRFTKASVSNNGGLLEQKLFEFDFSPFLKLQDEVKMNTNLVMVVHIDQEYDSHLFRRMYLSGWSPQQGFYEKAAPGEDEQPLQVPKQPAALPHRRFQCRETVTQEIFAVTLDPASLVALDYPLSVTPYTVWDTVSFKGAYQAESEVLHGVPLDLITAEPPSGNAEEGLSEKALHFYTAVDPGTKALLQPIAEELTTDFPLYYDKIYRLLDYFREGEYRYSLHPGLAPDGDQLRYFVTEGKKGYCSYFAFAYCLMLRSIGIPARIAAGFFLQPESGILNYYPVRANMAHAWVEVFFPYLGWVDIDPTTEQLADDESVDYAFHAGGDQFTQLLDEILLNRSSLRARHEDADRGQEAGTVMRQVLTFVTSYRYVLTGGIVLALLLLLSFLRLSPYVIIKFSRNNRKILLTLRKLHKNPSRRFYALTQKAKFAPVCTDADKTEALMLYRAERLYRKELLNHEEREQWKGKKKLRWAVGKTQAHKTGTMQEGTAPCAEQTEINGSGDGQSGRKKRGVLRIMRILRAKFLVLFFCLVVPVPLFCVPGAEELLRTIDKAMQAENWDGAAALLEEGIVQYPANELFQLKRGDLYFNNGLYEPAYRSFTEGLRINRYNIKLLYGAANAAAALNKEEEARQFLHEYLSYNPTDIFAWSSYGWLCFKTHRTVEGIKAMLDARASYGDDGCIANALGNLYGELFDYTNAAYYYTKGIELALQHNAVYSASVYSYNKAILEAAFYHFAQAEEDARNASDFFERASGYLILGELEERKNNFEYAVRYYTQSAEHNRTPLPLINLAKIHLRMGQWERAEQYIIQIDRVTDQSWIANFGMSTAQFYSERYNLYQMLYKKKYAAEKMRIPVGVKDFCIRHKNLIHYWAQAQYYRAAYSISHLTLAQEYVQPFADSTAHELYKNSFYYKAFESIPFKAVRYLRRAEALETSVIPKAQASYLAERGILLRDARLLREALELLDPTWERELRDQAAAVLISCTRTSGQRNELYRDLLQSNPACFPEYWIRLPVRLVCTGSDEGGRRQTQKRLSAALQKSLFTVSAAAPFTLYADCTTHGLSLSLTGDDGTVYIRSGYPESVKDKAAAARCVNQLAVRLFRR